MVSKKINKNRSESLKMQKNRFCRNLKTAKLRFGDQGLVIAKEGRIELIQVAMMKKIIKKTIGKKKSDKDIIREKVWYFGRPNFYIQKKSKNSRMGKGKGSVERRVIRIRRGVLLFEFLGIHILRIRSLAKKLNKFLNVQLEIISLGEKGISLWSKKNKYYYYHEKYLI